MAQLKATQQHGEATRRTATVTAKLALDAAEKKARELKEDRDALAVKAPFDGKLIYGQLTEGQWKGGEPHTLRPGEKVAAETVLMTLSPPQKLRVAIAAPEAALGWLKPGDKAIVHPLSWPELKLNGTASAPEPAGKGEGPEQAFKVFVTFDQPLDARIEPGRKASVRFTGPKSKDVLTLPVEAVSGGVVKVRANGETVDREVTIGRSDGKRVEIAGGLKEGDEVVVEETK
jgi:multidrug efflux pump subunit AcrA (membrane-fusion protein)